MSKPITRAEAQAAQLAAEDVADEFTAFAQLLQLAIEKRDADGGAALYARVAPVIFAARRLLEGVGESRESQRVWFFRLVEDVSRIERGQPPHESDEDAATVRSDREAGVRNLGAVSFVRAKLAIIGAAIAEKATDDVIREALDACVGARGTGSKWDRLVAVWRTLMGEKLDAATAKNAMSKSRGTTGTRSR